MVLQSAARTKNHYVFYCLFFFAVAVVCYANEGYIERQRETEATVSEQEKGESGGVGCLEAGELLDKTCFE